MAGRRSRYLNIPTYGATNEHGHIILKTQLSARSPRPFGVVKRWSQQNKMASAGCNPGWRCAGGIHAADPDRVPMHRLKRTLGQAGLSNPTRSVPFYREAAGDQTVKNDRRGGGIGPVTSDGSLRVLPWVRITAGITRPPRIAACEMAIWTRNQNGQYALRPAARNDPHTRSTSSREGGATWSRV